MRRGECYFLIFWGMPLAIARTIGVVSVSIAASVRLRSIGIRLPSVASEVVETACVLAHFIAENGDAHVTRCLRSHRA
jgi:hypothetical protein